MCPNHMIGESRRKKIVSVIVLAMKRPVPPNVSRSRGRDSTSSTVAIFGANHMIRVMTNSAIPASGRTKLAGPCMATASVPSTSSPIQAGEPRNINIAKAI